MIEIYLLIGIGVTLAIVLIMANWISLMKLQNLTHSSLLKVAEQTSERHQNNLVHIQSSLKDNLKDLNQQFDTLNTATQNSLLNISQAVEVKLAKGFEKTNETFLNIIHRLAIIDTAQQRIMDLSKDVVNLQAILTDKRSRGAFGEVQLHNLIQNLMPAQSYHLQYTLSNQTRADCLLLLPEPTGRIVIDAKFPLESYQKYHDQENADAIRSQARQQFKSDIKRHVQDIQKKYIIPGETSEGAVMFIPAEAIFAEIHAHHPDLVEYAWHARVWMASPSTMMAILTTACAVLKDFATRQEIHVIQEHLKLLAQDFSRFEKRMCNLTRHIQQANQDAELINTSAQKITKRFHQIEKADFSAEACLTEPDPLLEKEVS